MVICRTCNEANDLVSALGRDTKPYHRGVAEAVASENLKAWLDSSSSMVVGTSALGTRIHHPACQAVLHLGAPWGMTDYLQEAGRAGRDGRPAASIVFDWPGHPSPNADMVGSPAVGWTNLMDVLEKGECIREGTSKWMDGPALASTCSGRSGFAPCGRCIERTKIAEVRDSLNLAAPEVAPWGPAFRILGPEEIPVQELPGRWVERRERDLTAGPGSYRPGPSAQVSEHPGPAVSLPVLAPAEPVGRQVLADARAAHSRTWEDLQRPDTDPRAGNPSEPYCIEALLQAKSYLVTCCLYRVFQGLTTCQHPLSECLLCPPEMCVGYEMKGLWYRGVDLDAMKKHVKAVEQDLLVLLLKEGLCPAKETIPQICWLYLTAPDRLDDLARTFGLTSELDSIQRFTEWLCKSHKSGSYKGVQYELLNAYHVVLYLVYVDKRLRRFTPGAQLMT
ncbi:hypothetical protein FRC10_004279 [Ceratobasidium sp. 414]|nr:hypothetical protein FRC10_004279 [Ceratobasidium sp. 414]